MKMRDLEVWGVPSYIVDIWEKNYSPDLLPVQEEAVRDYGVLDYDGSKGLPRRSAPRNDNLMDSRMRGNEIAALSSKARNDKNRNQNLLVIAPTSSGKTFIGEMAAITQAIYKKKTIYLVPLRSLAEEKYHHFKDLYADCNINTLISSRDRREDDQKIIRGGYQIAVMIYEKFNYFLLEYPDFLREVSLIIIDEMQMIDDPVRGPLLEEIITSIRKKKPELKIIALSAFLDNQARFLNWISANSLLSYQRPVELRKGIVQRGIFKYITHNNYYRGEETFFAPDEVQENSYEDYLKKTVSYFIEKDEPTLLFLPTRRDTRKWAGWLAEQIDAPRAENCISELSRLEETRSRDELLYLLEKGIAYHNADLSWEERNLIETYLKKGEIKLICATTTLAMGINLPFKNVILSIDKYSSDDGDYRNSYRTSLTMTEVENMGGRAGRLNQQEKDNFGRAIFLADSLFSETVLQNLYFKALKPANPAGMPRINDPREKYNSSLKTDTKVFYPPSKKEKNFTNFLLKEIAGGITTEEKLNNQFKESTSAFKKEDRYWVFNFEEEDLKTEIKRSLERLVEYNLINYGKKDTEKLFPTRAGIMINSRRIDLDTYLLFKGYLENKRGKLTNLELITLLTKSGEGKTIPIPFPQFNQITDRYKKGDWKYSYQHKMAELVGDRGEEGKEIYQDILELKEENPNLDTEDYLSIKKTLLLYDWIGDKEIKEMEEVYQLYGGAIRKLAEGFSWLADSLAAVAESLGWNKKENKKEELTGIKILSERLAWGVEEEGLKLARLHIPGLSRSYIKALLKEGFDNEECMAELSVEELTKVLPQRLAQRIKNRINTKDPDFKLGTEIQEPITTNCKPASGISSPLPRRGRIEVGVLLNANDQQLTTILEINPHRPDRIIFEGKEIEVTAIEFSLIYLLAQNRGKILTHNDLLDTIWKENEDATYVQITYHLYKIRRVILKAIGKNKKNIEKVKDILKVISRRGIMLNLEEDKLKII
jgi:helicase